MLGVNSGKPCRKKIKSNKSIRENFTLPRIHLSKPGGKLDQGVDKKMLERLGERLKRQQETGITRKREKAE